MLEHLKKHGLLLIAQILLIIGCSNQLPDASSKQTERTVLIGNLESYSSPREIWESLGPDSSWEVIGESRLSPGDPRPPYDVLEVSIKDYLHCEFSGELRLHFFNGRLMATLFYPNEFQQYVYAVSKTYSLRLDRQEVTIPPFTLVQLSAAAGDEKEFGGRSYIMWSDTRLTQEMDDWILRHS